MIKISKQLITSNKVMDDTVSTLTAPKLKIEYATMKEDSLDFSGRDPNQLHCSEQEVLMREAGPCREYLMFEYHANKEVIITRRSYKKITTMLGEFGGIFKILTSMIFVFYGFYSMRKVKMVLGDLIFGEDHATREEVRRLIRGDGLDSGDKMTRAKIFRETQNRQKNRKQDKVEKRSLLASEEPSLEEIVKTWSRSGPEWTI